MKHQAKNIASVAILILLALTTAKSQPSTVYTKYVNSFIGTAPLNDPKILGYALPKGCPPDDMDATFTSEDDSLYR